MTFKPLEWFRYWREQTFGVPLPKYPRIRVRGEMPDQIIPILSNAEDRYRAAYREVYGVDPVPITRVWMLEIVPVPRIEYGGKQYAGLTWAPGRTQLASGWWESEADVRRIYAHERSHVTLWYLYGDADGNHSADGGGWTKDTDRVIEIAGR